MTVSVPASRRRYAINALAAVSMFAAAGCFEKPDDDDDDDDGGAGDTPSSIVGLWGLDSMTFYGETYDYPYSYSYDGYSYTYGVRMNIRTETSGEWYNYYEYSDPTGGSDSYTDDGYDITVTEIGTATYRIVLNDELSMDCTLSGSSLACDATIEGSEEGSLDWRRL